MNTFANFLHACMYRKSIVPFCQYTMNSAVILSEDHKMHFLGHSAHVCYFGW